MADRAEPQTTMTTTTKTARAVALERTIENRKQEEHEEEANIIRQFFLSKPLPPKTTQTPTPLPFFASTNLELKCSKYRNRVYVSLLQL